MKGRWNEEIAKVFNLDEIRKMGGRNKIVQDQIMSDADLASLLYEKRKKTKIRKTTTDWNETQIQQKWVHLCLKFRLRSLIFTLAAHTQCVLHLVYVI